jgi:hypothetical protein
MFFPLAGFVHCPRLLLHIMRRAILSSLMADAADRKIDTVRPNRLHPLIIYLVKLFLFQITNNELNLYDGFFNQRLDRDAVRTGIRKKKI